MMEVLPFSGIRCGQGADCSQQGCETTFADDGESEHLEHGGQNGEVDLKGNAFILKAQGTLDGKEAGGQWPIDGLPISEGNSDGSSYFDCLVESNGQIAPNDSLDSEGKLHQQGLFAGHGQLVENPELIVDTIEYGQEANQESDLLIPETLWSEQDEPLPVWVKRTGKWHAAIRCAQCDLPLASLKAKPTHDRKKYLLVFFPCRRNYSWVDMLLIRPINEFPQPIAYKTHEMGIEMVKDLDIPRRFMLLKLSVNLLNILEQLTSEVLVEVACNAASWTEFAAEVSQCNSYSDTGRILLKLQKMMLQCFFRSNWLHVSSQSWIQRCLEADSAESVELLKEELVDSIIWNDANSLSSQARKLELGSEMKTWKHEAMKWFSLSNPTEDLEPTSTNDATLATGLQTSRKRAKLEVRRAEVHTSQMETESSHQQITLEVDSGFFSSHDVLLGSGCSKEEITEEGASLMGGSPVTDRWDDIVIQAGTSDVIQMKDLEITAAESSMKPLPESKNHQCAAFIEAKGRQCERWASDGGIYCCVHLASHFAGSLAKSEATAVDSTMCEGTTVLGTKCKHRSLPGSSFCKKHQPQINKNISLGSTENKRKRKLEKVGNKADILNSTDIKPVANNGSSLCLAPVSEMGAESFNNSLAIVVSEQKLLETNDVNGVQCIGFYKQEGYESCLEGAKKFSLYCEKHLPSWLKRARNGKSRIVSKEVFLELLTDRHSRGQKLHLHQACELFYKLFKSIQSSRNPVPREVQFQWALAEASKHDGVKEHLQRLVSSEKQRLERVWGLGGIENGGDSLSIDKPVRGLISNDVDHEKSNNLRCKICSEKFVDDRVLGFHWMENHKKEAQWLFRGYVCSICLDSFTNKKVLEMHVQDRHCVQYVDQCMLFQCIPCGGHFGNSEELWSHVVSYHVDRFRLENAAGSVNGSIGEDSFEKVEAGNSAVVDGMIPENRSGIRRFTCRFCGLKFDLLPDLGRHHQAAHMPPNSDSSRAPKKGIRFYAYKLKTGRLSRPKFKKGLGSSAYRIRNKNAHSLKKRVQASNSIVNMENEVQPNLPEASGLGRLADSQCSAIAKKLFSEVKRTEPRPNNSDILAIAQSTCCKTHLQATLEAKYGILPKRIYLKAAKLCSERNILVTWHQDGFICPKGCSANEDPYLISPLVSLSGHVGRTRSSAFSETVASEWTRDESHYVIQSQYFSQETMEKLVLCDDISFGRESIPIACVVDENLLGSMHIPSDGSDDQISADSFPWEGFTYITKSMLDQSLCVELESLQLGCTCGQRCFPGSCDHVYLFDNDYEDAKDIYGKAMHGRFPYDERGRIILEEGYLVYECNQQCSCSKSCSNRVLQNGVQVKLEIFKTEKKGWAVRAREAVLRGTFICEYVGEVINEQEANERRTRHGEARCQYFYEIDAQVNDMSRLIEGQGSYVIDATNFGNVSRYINHSCSPNLVNHQVLVESMECELAHIGLYASRDIAAGEELTYNFRYKLSTDAESPCLCGATNCRGRLH